MEKGEFITPRHGGTKERVFFSAERCPAAGGNPFVFLVALCEAIPSPVPVLFARGEFITRRHEGEGSFSFQVGACITPALQFSM